MRCCSSRPRAPTPWSSTRSSPTSPGATAPGDVPQRPDDPADAVAAIEQKITDHQDAPCADGTYKDSVAQLAGYAGMDVSYTFEDIYQHCTRNPESDLPLAAFCSGDLDTVYVAWENSRCPELAADPAFTDVIRHETAHRLILERCQTTRPPIAGSVFEGMTSSYAVRCLGADADVLQVDDPQNEYDMTEQTDQMAQDVMGAPAAEPAGAQRHVGAQ